MFTVCLNCIRLMRGGCVTGTVIKFDGQNVAEFLEEAQREQ